jgi:predicted RNase H-like HicB family nuclease
MITFMWLLCLNFPGVKHMVKLMRKPSGKVKMRLKVGLMQTPHREIQYPLLEYWLVSSFNVTRGVSMSSKYERYSMDIQWRVKDEMYQVTVPELPGCMADGATREEAVQNAKKAIKRWIDAQEVAGKPIPAPSLYDSSF